MKHKHYDMIVAKAANMDLVMLFKLHDSSTWEIAEQCALPDIVSYDFFLCLPKHKDAALNALNGGESQTYRKENEEWREATCEGVWHCNYWYMREDRESRVKPRRENRWIGYCASTNQCTPHPSKTKDLAINYAAAHYNYADSDWQFIEIEVDV